MLFCWSAAEARDSSPARPARYPPAPLPRLLVIAAFALSLPACKTSDAAPAPPSAAPLSPSPAAAPSGVRPRAPVASAAPPQAAKATEAPVRYPFDRTHSPITPDLAARLRGIAAKNPKAQRDVFAKIGDSVTFSDDNLRCFAHKELELGSYAGLLPTIERFRKGNAAGTDPYRREHRANVSVHGRTRKTSNIRVNLPAGVKLFQAGRVGVAAAVHEGRVAFIGPNT